MTEDTSTPPSQTPEYYVGNFPAPGLRQIVRHITGHREDGKAHFLTSDHGEHYRFMGENKAVANIIYSTRETPVNLNEDVDVTKAKQEEPPFHYRNGSIVRMIDFGPGVESPFHRSLTIDYGIVIEGVFELTLDSGEMRIMRQGDVCVQRATAHKWKNITGNETMPGRMMWILLDAKELTCDGAKPVCRSCMRLKVECVYRMPTDEIRQEYEGTRERESTYAELFELLKVMSDEDAVETLRRLRSGMDAASILSHVKNGHLLIQLSLSADTTRRYEFPYISVIPSHLVIPGNMYLDSLLSHATLPASALRAIRETENPSATAEQIAQGETVDHDPDTSDYHITYLVPYHAARMVEPIADKIKARPWTRVISDDQLLRRLICAYFYYPHPCGPFIQKDLFLKDMAAGRTRFCTPLLVNAMLSLAIQSALDVPDRSKMWLFESLSYRFMAEARRLWDIESCKESSIPTIQAAMIISYTTTNNGMDQVGALYLTRALEMSKSLDLFGPVTHPGDPELDKARVFTAWVLYSWQALFNFSFFRPPPITKPPALLRPDANLSPEWYGEVWVQYPHTPTRNRLHVGHKLQAEVQLRHIMNELGSLMFGDSSRPLTINQIVGIKKKLDSWKDSLPECLQPKNLVFPLHLSLHVQYQQLVMGFMQIVLKSEHKDSPQILAACSGKAPETVLNEAKIMLETIMRLYYTRHNFEFYDPWIAFALTAIGNAVVADLAEGSDNDPQITAGYRSTLILAAQGLSKQARNYHVSRLLAIQLQKAMKPEDLQLVQTHTVASHVEDDEQALIAEHSDSLWPIPGLSAMNEDPEKTRLKNLIAGVQDLELQST
ncbi:Zn(2)-C6 fungal-type DNA-binding domain-containing protein [Fusarium mundagurra]|uniref:Zn(2)-C6 fungal-type DNA-binding domain-containing protein n=1 Tax=Fusarium mundagurra TaxID=1567541 RepID=A0A8H5YS23_9HYPO|nr:Zn(2)-C6 fungal-type DNA-binding domain-containing protein [Fusarium mundagurra]